MIDATTSLYPYEEPRQGGVRELAVIGNWKMNGSRARLAEMARVARGLKLGCVAGLCLPFTLLAEAQAVLAGTGLRWGAQDCSEAKEGAFTGEVSAAMIREFGSSLVIVGHAERRQGHAESDGQVAAKARRVLEADMTPVLCIGESREERDANQVRTVLRRQLIGVIRALSGDVRKLIIAYEPRWAIGSGELAAPALIEEAHEMIAEVIEFNAQHSAYGVRIVYGGSVSVRTAPAILERRFVGGVLVGGASLRPADFFALCRAADGGAPAFA